jgi:hypothetical protein
MEDKDQTAVKEVMGREDLMDQMEATVRMDLTEVTVMATTTKVRFESTFGG